MQRWLASQVFVFLSLSLAAFAQAAPGDFDERDSNGDGVLSGREAEGLASYDQDGDGEISLAEFQAGRAATRPAAGLDRAAAEAKFRSLDGNRDDRLSGTEMKGLEHMDADGNQRITLE
jgi:hypothetical protein